MSAVYSLAATFAFCSAHLSVMRLRFVEPDLYRPYRMPWQHQVRPRQHPGPLGGRRARDRHGVHAADLPEHLQLDLHLPGLAGARRAHLRPVPQRIASEPLWEPLEVPPPPDREVEHAPVRSPAEARALPHRPAREAHRRPRRAVASRHDRHRRRLAARAWSSSSPGTATSAESLIVLVFAAVSGLAVGVDLSPTTRSARASAGHRAS